MLQTRIATSSYAVDTDGVLRSFNSGTLAIGVPGQIYDASPVRTHTDKLENDAEVGAYVDGKGVLVNVRELALVGGMNTISGVHENLYPSMTVSGGDAASFCTFGHVVVKKSAYDVIRREMFTEVLAGNPNSLDADEPLVIAIDGFVGTKSPSVFKVTVSGVRDTLTLGTTEGGESGDSFAPPFVLLDGHSSVTIDWGDGTKNVYTATDAASTITHEYDEPGDYTVSISDDVAAFNAYDNEIITSVEQWGDRIRSTTTNGYNGTFELCNGIVSIPGWNHRITDTTRCYHQCQYIVGGIPPWNDVTTVSVGCYYDCVRLTGSIPPWNGAMVDASYCYRNCRALTGTIPEWNESMENVYSCYLSCILLSGNIPQWNEKISNAAYCYSACLNLDGVWDTSASDEELMPSRITYRSNCVFNASDSLCGYFTFEWGGTKDHFGFASIFKVSIPEDGGTLTLGLNASGAIMEPFKLLDGHSSVTIDWGDGDMRTFTADDASDVIVHDYQESGDFYVSISDDVKCFCAAQNEVITKVLHWGDHVKYAGKRNDEGNLIYYTFRGCENLASIPVWGSFMTDVSGCYLDCFALNCPIPAWGAAITDASFCYCGCVALEGPIPAWNSALASVKSCYQECESLIGSVPTWNAKITNAEKCYFGCTALTGLIPAWGAAITNAEGCYNSCSGLNGVWNPEASDEELMPSHIANHANCVYGATKLKPYFTSDWGGTKS